MPGTVGRHHGLKAPDMAALPTVFFSSFRGVLFGAPFFLPGLYPRANRPPKRNRPPSHVHCILID